MPFIGHINIHYLIDDKMLNSIIQFSVRNKLIVGLFVIGLIVWGITEVPKLPIDAVPDITNNQVLVITTAPSLGAPEVEKFITAPIEQSTRNIPGIIEQRSFSRFGLSLVTIVFNDETDIYWARNQITEKLVQAKEQIPPGLGTPELGPVSTGLGEVFQYVIRTKPGYQDKYNLTELRTIQDWIVRKQLLGTEGVADVSSFGGSVKQYEVSIQPEKLKSLNVSIDEVFTAVQRNNNNAGGAYIEKGPNVLFIRTEGMIKNMEELGDVVVKLNSNQVPLLIRDVASIKIGEAVRYGATVYNDEGEVAGAVVMMLKGENSNKVIGKIKERIKKIEKTLPEGVIIESFLDRSKMVNSAIGTVEKNLLEGALIIVFVLVLFIGNLRAGFIVASVIPLSMLFAIIAMNLFGVSGNLMSLGALDFGLLVDGAVIIVEAVLHRMRKHTNTVSQTHYTQLEMDATVGNSARQMMRSAVFGQIIILIVYLPILALQGIEGKMFRPMAQTVSFAVIGAFILSLTYVPMMSALLLSKKTTQKRNFSDRMMLFFQKIYEKTLNKILLAPRLVVTGVVILLATAMFILSTLGGEFIPKLEEGDFAVETRVLTGSSLSTTVQATQQSAKLLLERFPEVQKVVTKIGSGEIPTDPMPIEAADLMIILKDKSEWVSAKTFDELAEKMGTALADIPGITTGFQYPVQMRFNELMTGARQDIVCKIFGDDLDSLAKYANQLGEVVNTIDGAKDLYVETVTGIPQIVIQYNRSAIARYGIDIESINRTIQTAYAGNKAGMIFENEKRFDLVVRMNKVAKENPEAINNLMIPLPSGQQIPLSQVAMVHVKDGPYQIQREDAQRRITVGMNVRGRDVASVVGELQKKIQNDIMLPPGYYVSYGGQYENLQHATKRLSVALPIALLLIFAMLFFGIKKIKYCLLIFTAIPMSAIGGVIALWIRDMPFSISAGVGFIALFGVAVLNGIVLINEMIRLREEERITNIKEIIFTATKARLRPVLMTAAVASLGFLPMALSNGAGAEVQRPLATVVIGGLLTATALTLLVLPALYLLFNKTKSKNFVKVICLLAVCLTGIKVSNAQSDSKSMKLDNLITLAYKHSDAMRVEQLRTAYYSAMKKTARDMPKTQISTELGNYNSFNFDSKISIVQTFSAGAVYKKQQSVLDAYLDIAEAQQFVQKSAITKMVKELYLELQFFQSMENLFSQLDSVYNRMETLANLRYEKGETDLLEKTSILERVRKHQLIKESSLSEKRVAQLQLSVLIKQPFLVEAAELLSDSKILEDTTLIHQHAELKYQAAQQKLAIAETQLLNAKLKPDWFIGYNNQSLTGWHTYKDLTEKYFNAASRFSSLTAGISLSLFNKAQKEKIAAAKINENLNQAVFDQLTNDLRNKLQKAIENRKKHANTISYFKTKALPGSNTIMDLSFQNYQKGQINYIEWASLMQQAFVVQVDYLITLKQMQLNEIEIHHLLQIN